MLKIIMVISMVVSVFSHAATHEEFNEQVSEAQENYVEFKANNEELVADTISTFDSLKQEIKSNKELRKLIKKARKNPELRPEVEAVLKHHFEEKGISFGQIYSEGFLTVHAAVGGVLYSGSGSSVDYAIYEVGPGIGISRGYGIVACLVRNISGVNVGVSARAIVGVGIQMGLYFGSNGICVMLGAAYGLDVSAGVGVLITN